MMPDTLSTSAPAVTGRELYRALVVCFMISPAREKGYPYSGHILQRIMSPIRSIEECSQRAWPCLDQEEFAGWFLRFAEGFTRRSNSANAVHPEDGDPAALISHCEQAYRARGLPPIFRITPLAQPPHLDALLGERGYGKEGETSVQVLERVPAASGESAGLHLHTPPGREWLDCFTALDDTPSSRHETLRAILARIASPHAGAVLRVNRVPAGCGRGVVEGEWIGLFDIVTHPRQRRQGIGGRVIAALLHWGTGQGALGTQGATRAYLQVETANQPAIRLYAKLGFREIYRYWYRVLG